MNAIKNMVTDLKVSIDEVNVGSSVNGTPYRVKDMNVSKNHMYANIIHFTVNIT